ncbi:GNAT family N-acetyltransferase [Halalkalibacter wakoensis]|uniref:GNAT family N-acetyltransferase n=1 Tax=Halalkalibacter wakoensis TaxID=127891 RepID=UPI0005556F2E|nr:GNAT family N-acetyltransferase [Halalkalibacter wakoensis]
MIIRKATAAELQFIKNYAPIVQEEATVGYATGDKLMMNDQLHYFYQTEYLALTNQGNMYGWILVGQTKTPIDPEPVGMILELYVLPAYRKKGYGELLMNSAMEYLRNQHFKKVQLNVFAGNRAKQLYEELGFKDVSTLMERPL